MMNNDILFQTHTDACQQQLAIIILNRPTALNALTGDMFLRLQDQLLQWENDPSIKAVLIKSAVEKAFCAGGDIRAIYDNKHLSVDEIARYFRREYDVNKMIHHYKKPYIALTHGITMGGGVGISVHASHRVAAENLRWAMPETLIGFFSDVGASYYLSRLPNAMGAYLALTGNTMTAAHAYALYLIDHIVPKAQFDALEKTLVETIFNANDREKITNIIAQFSLANTKMEQIPNAQAIKQFFSFETIEEIFNALRSSDALFGMQVLTQLEKCSPTSLKVTLQQLLRATHMPIDDVFEMDFLIARGMLGTHDFYEGVRAAIIDKDRNPRWKPRKISEVTNDRVAQYFGLSAE